MSRSMEKMSRQWIFKEKSADAPIDWSPSDLVSFETIPKTFVFICRVLSFTRSKHWNWHLSKLAPKVPLFSSLLSTFSRIYISQIHDLSPYVCTVWPNELLKDKKASANKWLFSDGCISWQFHSYFYLSTDSSIGDLVTDQSLTEWHFDFDITEQS